MEACLCVPHGTDISIIINRYPDLYEDEGWEDEGVQHYWCGDSSDEPDDDAPEYMTYEQCVEFCGFCDGAIDAADTCIEGNGEWAMGMIRETGFKGEGAEERKRISDIYWAAHARGQEARKLQEQTP